MTGLKIKHVSYILLITLLSLSGTYNHILSRNDLFESNDIDIEPPPHGEYAKMARFVVHNSDWTAMGTLSTLNEIKGFPMVNVISIADSARNEDSTGNIYFYLTILDFTAQDLKKDNRLTMLLSMDQNQYCTKQGIDPMEPTCARIMISGKAVQLAKDTDEYHFGNTSMFSRHPAAKNWIAEHNFFLCKLEISNIVVLDYYGGPHIVTIDEYFNVKTNDENFLENNLNYPSTKSKNRNDVNKNELDVDTKNEVVIKIPKNYNIRVITTNEF